MPYAADLLDESYFSGIEARNGNAREELHSGTPASARLALSTSST